MIVIAEIYPLDLVAGVRKVQRCTTHNLPEGTGVNDQIWTPAIAEPPVIAFKFFKGDFDGTASVTGGSLKIKIDALARNDALIRRYLWSGAPIKLWAGNKGQAWPWQMIFDGRVDDFTSKDNIVDLKTKVNDEPFQADVLILKYAGTGGIEGGVDLKERPKPLALGRCQNIVPVQINSVDNVYQVHGYGQIQSVTALYERGSAFGAPLADYPTYAALIAASVPAGRWVTCLAQGLFRLGAPPYGVITADVDGDQDGGIWRRQPGAIILRLCALAGINPAITEMTSFAAIDTQLSTFPNQGRIGHYQVEQISVISLAAQLANDVNHVVGVSHLGKIYSSSLVIGAPTLILDAQRRETPRVGIVSERTVSAPYSLIELGYAKSGYVHGDDDIATVSSPEPGATNNANIDDPNQLIINEKIRLIASEAARVNRKTSIRARLVALNTPAPIAAITNAISALDSSEASWLSYRNSITPAWDNTTAHSIIVRSAYNAFSQPFDAALNVSDVTISEEDARRSSWSGVTGPDRPQDNATNDRVADTRHDNFSPLYYYTNFSYRVRNEFKQGVILDVPGFAGLGYYGALVTTVDYENFSGGPVKQRFTGGTAQTGMSYVRVSISNTTWGPWQRDFNGFAPPRLGAGGDVLDQGGVALTDQRALNEFQQYDDLQSLPQFLTNTVNVGGLPRIRSGYLTDDAGLRSLEAYFPSTPDSDNTANAQVTVISPAAQVINRNYDGSQKPNQFAPRVLTPVIKRGSTDIRTDSNTTLTLITNPNFTATVNTTNGDPDKGRISISAGTQGSLRYNVTVAGGTYGPFEIPFTVSDDPVPQGGGAGSNGTPNGSDASFPVLTSASEIQISRVNADELPLNIVVATGQTVNYSLSAIYKYMFSANSGPIVASRSVNIRVGYRVAGTSGAFTFGPLFSGAQATWNRVDQFGDAGQCVVSGAFTGLAAGTYEIAFFAALNTATSNGSVLITDGTAYTSAA